MDGLARHEDAATLVPLGHQRVAAMPGPSRYDLDRAPRAERLLEHGEGARHGDVVLLLAGLELGVDRERVDAVDGYEHAAAIWVDREVHPGRRPIHDPVQLGGPEIRSVHLAAHPLAREPALSAHLDPELTAHHAAGAVAADEILGADRGPGATVGRYRVDLHCVRVLAESERAPAVAHGHRRLLPGVPVQHRLDEDQRAPVAEPGR